MSIYDIPVTTPDGRETTMADWQGHLLLIVNTASECGLTPQYEQLQQLFSDYAARGLFVLGVPCNQFGGQEPGTATEIDEFCSRNYGVEFPMLAKCDVNGPDTHPLFEQLKQHPYTDGSGESAGEIKWNFEKFLVSPEGEILGRFNPKVEPDDDVVIDMIEEYLPI